MGEGNTLQATQHTMLKKRAHIGGMQKLVCGRCADEGVGQRKFEYRECFKHI